MGNKKVIRCPKCKRPCVEVGHSVSYPKSIEDPDALREGRTGHEYRYVCPSCGGEYIQDTLNRVITEIPEGADFRIRLVKGEERVQVNSLHMLRLWGLPLEKKGIELAAREVRKLQRRVRRIKQSLSSNQCEDEVFIWERFKLTSEEIRKLIGRDI